MEGILKSIDRNPLESKQHLREALRQLVRPLKPLYEAGGSRLPIKGSHAGYGESIAGMEGFSRILWGIVPDLAGGGTDELWEDCLRGIISGTDPEHKQYWGDVADYDQRLVEMAVLGMALCMIPERIWEPFGEKERRNLYNWLNLINAHPCHDCNWLFFHVMVNMGFYKTGQPYDKVQMEKNLQRIEEFYLGRGWYSDGVGGHSDYYVPFAIQYYGLIYSKLMEKEDPERCGRFKERAKQFAGDFIHWFSPDGSSLAYGRSMTYRFAQSAFWSAFAYAEAYTDVFTPGVVKGLIMRNLRWWFKQPIFDAGGILTVGYAYPNLVMAENYNSPGSPYWALKTFLVLALGDRDRFWNEPELELPQLPALSVQPEPHLVLCRQESTGHVTAFNAGHLSTNEHTHTSAKYEKFAYSSAFGFSVPRAEWGLGQAAMDSTLGLSERDNLYRVRRVNKETWIRGRVLYAKWLPWSNVEVETWIVAGLPWHVLIHRIQTGRSLDAAEGGFALGLLDEETVTADGLGISAVNAAGSSGIYGLLGYTGTLAVYPNADTNLLHPRTVLPTLTASLEPGTHLLAAAVYGQPGTAKTPELEEALIELGVTVGNDGLSIKWEDGESLGKDVIHLRR
ncbi:DUF2264 domain-containing protein [Paenibacillus sp. M1]|uniref:DUF2264 domain-containing protein n=1 Tax=Paenibacillus haidiansis TaxID=1574488 RepID=A0ABU7VXG4_9BACL